MSLLGLMHAHSSLSFDGLLPPRAYLAYARRVHLDFVCLTDHNTIAGSLELARLNGDPRLQVVVGAEYATEVGDLIGLFLREEIRERTWAGVVAAVRDQGGLLVLPHPHRNHELVASHWRDVDLVEVFNARSSPEENRASLRDAQAAGLPQVIGADIHTMWELVRNRTLITLGGQGDLRELLLEAPRTFGMRRSSPLFTRYSQLVKVGRRRLGHPGRR